MANPTNPRPGEGPSGPPGARNDKVDDNVKTTMMLRKIANPRRTTLVHLADADELQAPATPEHAVDLPTQTANPKRTVLMEVPAQASAAE